MKTIDLFFDANEIALFLACFHLNTGDFKGVLCEDDKTLA